MQKRGGPKGINWIAVRTAYVVERWSAARCAEKFGVDIATVKRRASRDGWTAERHQNVTISTEVATEAARDIAAKAGEQAGMAHLQFVHWLGGIIKDSEADLLQIQNAASRIKARRDISEMGERWLKVGRLVLGVKDGAASDATVSDDRDLTIVRSVVHREPIDEAAQTA